MMYFMNGKFIVDFNAIEEFITDLCTNGSEFITNNALYAVIGLSGFLVGVLWHTYMNWKIRREEKKIEEQYVTSDI